MSEAVADLLFTRANVTAVRTESREVDFVASTEDLDAHGTILRQNWNLDRFNANPVIFWNHGTDEVPVAKAKVKVEGSKREGKRLVGTAKFRAEGRDERADRAWAAVEDEYLRGWSVSFRAATERWEKSDDREYLVLDDLELFHIALTAQPSNANTLSKVRARALAVVQSSPPAQGDQNREVEDMSENLLARTLGLSTDATDDAVQARAVAVVSERTQLIEATGEETFDAAMGTIRQMATDLVEARKAAETSERDSIVARLRAEKRVTPAQESSLLPKLDLEGLRAFAESAPVVFAEDGLRQPSESRHSGDVDVTKPFALMTGSERAELRKSDLETYNTLRNEWIAAGRPTK